MVRESLPTLAAMLLYWLLAAYVATRSPRGAISLTATGALASTALYLLSQLMAANAQSLDEWRPWVRNLGWAPHLAPILWYWLTLLLLRETDSHRASRYLRIVGYPVGVGVALAGAVLAASLYLGDALHAWSGAGLLPPDRAIYGRFFLPPGPLYVWFMALIAVDTALALVNVGLARALCGEGARRRPLTWLFVSGVFLAAGAHSLGPVNWLTGGQIPAWIGHTLLAAGMAVMAWNVAAYSLLFRGQVIPRDFFHFLTAIGSVCLLYVLVFLVVGVEFTFPVIALSALTLTAAVLSHALADVCRRVLDRVFFATDVQRLRTNLASVAQSAALTPDFGAVLHEAQSEIQEASTERLVRLTEQALRRLNAPALLAECDLVGELPRMLAASKEAGDGAATASTPLERAGLLRETLVATIGRLKPPQGEAGIESPAALQYHILHEEYLQGLLNKQIMARHAISEGTFNRNRRQAIRALALELKSGEDRLAAQRNSV